MSNDGYGRKGLPRDEAAVRDGQGRSRHDGRHIRGLGRGLTARIQ